MNSMDERQLDKFFKEHLDNFQDDGSSHTPWNKMDGMLDQHIQAARPGFFISRRIFWTAASVVLLLISSLVYGIWRHNVQMEALYTTVEDMREELDGRSRVEQITRVDTLVLLAGPDGTLHGISPSQLEALNKNNDSLFGQAIVPNRSYVQSANTHRPSTIINPIYTQLSNNSTLSNSNDKQASQETAPTVSEALPLSKDGIYTPDSTMIPSEEKKQEDTFIAEKTSTVSRIDSTQIEKERRYGQKAPPKKLPEKKDSFLKKLAKQLQLRTGIEGSLAGGGSEYAQLNTSYAGGLGAELRIRDRFALRTGARISSFSYDLEGLDEELLSEDFLSKFPGAGAVDPGAEVYEIKMSGTYFEIPLGLRYYYPLNRTLDAFTGLDISGGTFLHEDFTYEIYQDNDEFYRRSKASNIPWNWGRGRFSMGAAFTLNRKLKLETAIFFEKDLEGRGVEDFEYYLVGLSTSVWLSQ